MVGVEDAPGQQDLVLLAAREARLRGCALHILHAVPLATGSGRSSAEADQAEKEARAREGAAVVDRFEALVREEFPGLAVQGELPFGSPAATLLERSAHASLLVVGHRGSGGFPRLPLGSVSWQVATHARCPVLVPRPRAGGGRPRNLVVTGLDISDVSREALDVAYEEAVRRDASLDLLYAAPLPGALPIGPMGTVVPDIPQMDAIESGAREFIEREIALRVPRYPQVPVSWRVVHQRPARALVDASEEAALLVVGCHGRTGLRRLFLGSVSAEVLHLATCPVMVVPPSDAGSD